jgi:ribosomal protein S2
MIALITRMIRNRKAVNAAVTLIKTIEQTSKDGKLTREEQSLVLKEFWALVREVKGIKNGDIPTE